MARVRPVKPMLFADHVNDAVERMTGLLAVPRLPGDRSQFVRFARAAARLAEWQRAGDIQSGESGWHRFGDGLLALVEVADVHAEPSSIKPDDLVRLIEATNAQLVPQTCLVKGDAEWIDHPSLLAGREVTALGDTLPWAAVKAFAGERVDHARSQLLTFLVPTDQPLPLIQAAPRLAGWSLQEFLA